MSIDATKWAWKQKCKPMEKLILVLLCDHLNGHTARLNPGTKKLCEESGMTRQGVFNQIEKLEKSGLLFVERSSGSVNNYRIPVNGVDQSTALTSQPDGLPPVNGVDYHQSTPLTGPVNGVDLNHKEPEDEPEIKPGNEKSKSNRVKKPKIVPQISERGFAFADWFRTLIPEITKLEKGWRENWAKCYDDMIRLDSRTPAQIAKVCQWATQDGFWAKNFLSPTKLRKSNKDGVNYFDVLSSNLAPAKSPLTSLPKPATDPEGWIEYLDRRKAPHAPYATARGWMKEEFHAGWKETP